jgi:hypothetical protein
MNNLGHILTWSMGFSLCRASMEALAGSAGKAPHLLQEKCLRVPSRCPTLPFNLGA